MIDTARITEPVAPRRLNDVRRANRALLIFCLLPFLLSVVFAASGLNSAVLFFISDLAVLAALQSLFRGTAESPFQVLKRCRNVSLPVALSLAALMLVIDRGLITFASAFTPRLYEAFAFLQPTVDSAWEMALLSLSLVVFAPFTEEFIFRGVMLKAYRDARSVLFAVLFTSVLFSFIHGSLVHTFAYFPATVIVALAVLKTGQLWTAIAAHALYNFTITLLKQFDALTLPATPTFGIWGLVVAAAVFWIGLRWMGASAILNRTKLAKRKTVWTVSLIVVLALLVFLNVFTTYVALAGIEL